mmetsp:Transcript_1356/g.2417  ORF Transcript_1356/g.2417 Transcript_1356/m.2417 type:complete len:169 (+) Transcript_1356:164-670(+)
MRVPLAEKFGDQYHSGEKECVCISYCYDGISTHDAVTREGASLFAETYPRFVVCEVDDCNRGNACEPEPAMVVTTTDPPVVPPPTDPPVAPLSKCWVSVPDGGDLSMTLVEWLDRAYDPEMVQPKRNPCYEEHQKWTLLVGIFLFRPTQFFAQFHQLQLFHDRDGPRQ